MVGEDFVLEVGVVGLAGAAVGGAELAAPFQMANWVASTVPGLVSWSLRLSSPLIGPEMFRVVVTMVLGRNWSEALLPMALLDPQTTA